MSPRNYPNGRRDTDVDRIVRELGSRFSLPASSDAAVRAAVEAEVASAGYQPRAARRELPERSCSHKAGSTVIAELKREVERLSAVDKLDDALAEQYRRAELRGRKRSNEALAWQAARAASDDIKNRPAWNVIAECFRQTSNPGQAIGRLLGATVSERTLVTALELLGRMLDDDF